jgi:hypothetical protein
MQNLAQILSTSKSVLILLPTNPHFDQVAAGLGLFKALKANNVVKDVSISCPTPMMVEFNRLIDVDKISSELGNKNLLISFKNYAVDDLNTVTYEIVGNEIQIKVEPKPGVLAPKQDQIDLTYSGVAADTAILIGGAHDGHFPILGSPELKDLKIIHVGVRDINLSVKPLSLARQASSISEIVLKLITDSNWEIDADLATNLLMGIEEGSKNFSSQETSAETFSAMAKLLQMGGKREVKRLQPDPKKFPPGSIPTRPYFGLKQQTPPTQTEAFKQEAGEVPKAWLGTPKVYKSSEGGNS